MIDLRHIDLGRVVGRLKRLFAGPEPASSLPGRVVATTGEAAVALVEDGMGATRSAGSPARAAIAGAMGLSLSGARVSVTVDGAELSGAAGILQVAAGRSAPMVVHVLARAGAAHALPDGGGHDGALAAADTGCIVLFAANVQELVDLAVVARKVTEQALVPVVLLCDADRTGAGLQDVAIPDAGAVCAFLGLASDGIPCATPMQTMLFGEQRRRVPRWLDVDRPALLGGVQGPGVFGLGAAGRASFVAAPARELLSLALDDWGRRAGRPVSASSEHRTEGAELILVAAGAMSETACALADHLRAGGLAAGAVTLRALGPLPGPRLAGVLAGAQRVLVLERIETALDVEPPLTRAVRAALGRALENERFGKDAHPGYPAVSARRLPRVKALRYGIGGLQISADALRAAAIGEDTPAVLCGGVAARSTYPKRQAMLDEVAGAHPGIERTAAPHCAGTDLRPPGAVTVAVVLDDRPACAKGLAGDLGSLLLLAGGGSLRGIAASTGAGGVAVDRVTYSPAAPLRDPGDRLPVDLLVLATREKGALSALDDVREGGAVLLAPWLLRQLPASVLSRLEEIASVFTIAPGDHERERLLGAAAGLLRRRAPASSSSPVPKDRRLVECLRQELRDEADAEARAGAFEAALGAEPGPFAGRGEGPAPDDPAVPFAARKLGSPDGVFGNLGAFFDQVGVLYRSGGEMELSAEPILTAGATPPLAGTLQSRALRLPMLPVLDPGKCTGCGKCWTVCPDAAWGPVALSARGLVEAGMKIASDGGGPADALRPVLGKLAGRLSKAYAESGAPPAALSAVLAETGMAALDGLPEERKAKAAEALRHVCDVLAPLRVARTEPFFRDGERNAPGNGELLVLALNPDACSGCGACVTACADEALRPGPPSAVALGAARRSWRLWELLPDTPGATVERLRSHHAVGRAAGTLLSRHCSMVLAGSDGSEPGSGEKLALRLVLAGVEAVRQPLALRQIDAIEGLRARVAARIRELVADAVPTDDLRVLAEGLGALSHGERRLSELSGRIEAGATRGLVDRSALTRLVALGNELANQRWLLAEGDTKLGRARAVLVVAPGSPAEWIGAFPGNPLSIPVLVSPTRDVAELASGVMEGLVRAALLEADVRRRATAALGERGPNAPSPPPPASFAELTAEERSMCPPVVVLCDAGALGDDCRKLLALLRAGLPILLLVLRDRLDTAGVDLAMEAVGAGSNAIIAQSTVAHPDHLLGAVFDAVASAGPALLHVYAPVPARTGVTSEAVQREAARAVGSGGFPLLVYDPLAGDVPSARLNVEGNPDHGELPGSGRLQVLLELAGKVSPSAARLRAELEKTIGAERDAAIERLKQEHASALAGLRADIEAEIQARVRERLVAMARRQPSGRG